MTKLDRQMRALISVSDKTGIVRFAQALVNYGFTILSTGGTATVLRDGGVDVVEVSRHTGFPEIMDGRVKTLHPKVHAGLLGKDEHEDVMAEHGIERIHLLVVNLYPFEQVVKKSTCTFAEAIENIDIGGPAMLRSAAKNHERVTVVTDPADYQLVLAELESDGQTLPSTRFQLAMKVFARTSQYDAAIKLHLEYLAKLKDQQS